MHSVIGKLLTYLQTDKVKISCTNSLIEVMIIVIIAIMIIIIIVIIITIIIIIIMIIEYR